MNLGSYVGWPLYVFSGICHLNIQDRIVSRRNVVLK